jgi:hypothetical protein
MDIDVYSFLDTIVNIWALFLSSVDWMSDMLISASLQISDSVAAEIQLPKTIQLLEPAVPCTVSHTDDVGTAMSGPVAPYSMPYTDGTVMAQFDPAELYETPLVQHSVCLVENNTGPVCGGRIFGN